MLAYLGSEGPYMRKKTMAPMEGATIQDVFVKGTQIAIYTRTARGIEALSVFSVEDRNSANA